MRRATKLKSIAMKRTISLTAIVVGETGEMTEQQEPFGESEQMWVPPRQPGPIAVVPHCPAERIVITHLRHPEPAAVGWVVQNHSFVRDRAQVVRMLRAYADALERVILPAVKP